MVNFKDIKAGDVYIGKEDSSISNRLYYISEKMSAVALIYSIDKYEIKNDMYYTPMVWDSFIGPYIKNSNKKKFIESVLR